MLFLNSASNPTAVLPSPLLLPFIVSNPMAVLLLPVVLLKRASAPIAVLKLPVVLLWSAFCPNIVFWATAKVALESPMAKTAIEKQDFIADVFIAFLRECRKRGAAFVLRRVIVDGNGRESR